MLRTGKHFPKSQNPAPTPSSVPAKGQVHGEGSYGGTRDMEKAEAAGRQRGAKTPTPANGK